MAITFRRHIAGVLRCSESAADTFCACNLPGASRTPELYLQALQVGIREFHSGHADHRLRQPIYRELQALDIHDQFELGMREEIAAQEILKLRFVQSTR